MSKYYFVGSGIASLAGAAYLIRDGNVDGRDIVIFEESRDFGGALDAHGNPSTGYFMSGSRMFENKYNCTFDLMSSIPSSTDPDISVTDETNLAKVAIPWHNRARLVDRVGKIVDAHRLGFIERDRMDLLGLLATSESHLDGKRVSDCFNEHFFQTNFWIEWSTLFAFQRWHSAIEFRRYLLRFIHHFSTIDTQEGIYRTVYNQYDSMAVPLAKWLNERGVRVQFETVVDDLRFNGGNGKITVESIECTVAGSPSSIPLGEDNYVFVTNGSMTADKAFGTMTSAPVLNREKTSGAWRLWETIARDRPEFGNPAVFDGHIEESVWESFTVTSTDRSFLQFMEEFTGSEPGKGGLVTFKHSSWLLTLSIYHQPFFPNQTDPVSVWWGYGLHYGKFGDYVHKPMSKCSGREIFEEVLGHLHLDSRRREAMLATANVVPCVMPYITSQFLVRKDGDRPRVVPHGSTNLAFIGQYVELPDDVVFTVEYSIRSAQAAVYSLLHLHKRLTPIYKGYNDVRVLMQAIQTLHR